MYRLRPVKIVLISFFLIQSIFAFRNALPENKKVFKTRYTEIIYSDDKALGDFLWRIGGKRFNFTEDLSLAKSRVDRIIDRVQSILEMHIDDFNIKINLYPEYKSGSIAFYSYRRKTITVYADRITDGIFAHEVAHAVICSYFKEPPPEKIQEALAQYVDKYLWSDYY